MLKSIALRLLPDPILKHLKKIYYVHELNIFSEKDEPDLRVVRHLVKPGDHVVDIGANIGWYTKFLAETVGPNGRVYSIEPVRMTFEILSYCVNRLGLQNVNLQCCAISDREGEAVMEIPSFNEGGENFYRASIIGNSIGSKSTRHVRVCLTSFDKMFKDSVNPIKFVKCDVEGHELAVIKGARGVIEKYMPAWLIEISDNADERQSPSNELFSILTSYGYRAYWFDGEHLIQRASGDRSVNYFFLTPEQKRAYDEEIVKGQP